MEDDHHREADGGQPGQISLDDLFDAAQCIWEDVLTRIGTGGPFEAAADELGMAEIRGRLRDPRLLEACCRGWEKAEEAMNGAPFDWEYVPLFVNACIDAETAELKPNWEERLDAALAEEEAPKP